MKDYVWFSVPDSKNIGAPVNCPLCKLNPVIFEYWLNWEPKTDRFSPDIQGFCCLPCSFSLLLAMEKTGIKEWAKTLTGDLKFIAE